MEYRDSVRAFIDRFNTPAPPTPYEEDAFLAALRDEFLRQDPASMPELRSNALVYETILP